MSSVRLHIIVPYCAEVGLPVNGLQTFCFYIIIARSMLECSVYISERIPLKVVRDTMPNVITTRGVEGNGEGLYILNLTITSSIPAFC